MAYRQQLSRERNKTLCHWPKLSHPSDYALLLIYFLNVVERSRLRNRPNLQILPTLNLD